MTTYRILEAGEIIRAGDEADSSAGWNDEAKWVPATCIGEPAPDPAYPAHRRYRRPATAFSDVTIMKCDDYMAFFSWMESGDNLPGRRGAP